MLTYHPEDHGGGVDAPGIGGHTGVVASILEDYVIEFEGEDFLITVVTEVGLLRDCELQPEGTETLRLFRNYKELGSNSQPLKITICFSLG